ncbi:MAG: hypothetical protein NT023_09255 [Armatimonadetes bacterium]|nr:hypothetical protein [Armatimonadota bacterium]
MFQVNALLKLTACVATLSIIASNSATAQNVRANDPRFGAPGGQVPLNNQAMSPYIRSGVMIPNRGSGAGIGNTRGNISTTVGNLNFVPFNVSVPPDSDIFAQMARTNEIHGYNSPLSPFILRQPAPNARPHRYRNGLWGRSACYIGWGNNLFPNGSACYPYYSPVWSTGYSSLSPYYFYWGVSAPFLMNDFIYQMPPNVVYVPVPVYTDRGDYRGWKQEDIDGYYLNKKAPDENKPKSRSTEGNKDKAEALDGVAATVIANSPVAEMASKIQKAWVDKDVQSLSEAVDKQKRIAVYLRGKYQYSLPPQDYLDLTRDALQSTQTQRFEMDTPQRKEKGVYILTGKHTYKGGDGESHVVYVSYVVELVNQKYVITQVGTAPERITPKTVRESFQKREDNAEKSGEFETKE